MSPHSSPSSKQDTKDHGLQSGSTNTNNMKTDEAISAPGGSPELNPDAELEHDDFAIEGGDGKRHVVALTGSWIQVNHKESESESESESGSGSDVLMMLGHVDVGGDAKAKAKADEPRSHSDVHNPNKDEDPAVTVLTMADSRIDLDRRLTFNNEWDTASSTAGNPSASDGSSDLGMFSDLASINSDESNPELEQESGRNTGGDGDFAEFISSHFAGMGNEDRTPMNLSATRADSSYTVLNKNTNSKGKEGVHERSQNQTQTQTQTRCPSDSVSYSPSVSQSTGTIFGSQSHTSDGTILDLVDLVFPTMIMGESGIESISMSAGSSFFNLDNRPLVGTGTADEASLLITPLASGIVQNGGREGISPAATSSLSSSVGTTENNTSNNNNGWSYRSSFAATPTTSPGQFNPHHSTSMSNFHPFLPHSTDTSGDSRSSWNEHISDFVVERHGYRDLNGKNNDISGMSRGDAYGSMLGRAVGNTTEIVDRGWLDAINKLNQEGAPVLDYTDLLNDKGQPVPSRKRRRSTSGSQESPSKRRLRQAKKAVIYALPIIAFTLWSTFSPKTIRSEAVSKNHEHFNENPISFEKAHCHSSSDPDASFEQPSHNDCTEYAAYTPTAMNTNALKPVPTVVDPERTALSVRNSVTSLDVLPDPKFSYTTSKQAVTRFDTVSNGRNRQSSTPPSSSAIRQAGMEVKSLPPAAVTASSAGSALQAYHSSISLVFKDFHPVAIKVARVASEVTMSAAVVWSRLETMILKPGYQELEPYIDGLSTYALKLLYQLDHFLKPVMVKTWTQFENKVFGHGWHELEPYGEGLSNHAFKLLYQINNHLAPALVGSRKILALAVEKAVADFRVNRRRLTDAVKKLKERRYDAVPSSSLPPSLEMVAGTDSVTLKKVKHFLFTWGDTVSARDLRDKIITSYHAFSGPNIAAPAAPEATPSQPKDIVGSIKEKSDGTIRRARRGLDKVFKNMKRKDMKSEQSGATSRGNLKPTTTGCRGSKRRCRSSHKVSVEQRDLPVHRHNLHQAFELTAIPHGEFHQRSRFRP